MARWRFVLYALSFLLLLTGCAGPRTTLMEQVRGELHASRAEAAYNAYKKKVKPDTQRVDELLNLGLLAYEAGDYTACHRALARADEMSEERQTKSLSREAAGVAVSDRVRAYQGTVFDKAMIHYYRSLAFLAEGKTESAVVEGRRVASYLEVNARESRHAYKDDAFLQWFNGALYDRAGQANDAWISYKRARQLYGNYYGINEPSFLCPVTQNAARKVGIPTTDDCGIATSQSTFQGGTSGRVVVICETGIAPPIRESNIVIPITETVPAKFASDEERDRYYYGMYERHRHQPYYEETRLKYVLRVALPFYPEAERAGSGVADVVVNAGSDYSVRAELGEDVGAILRQDLDDRYPAIVARAIARAIVKYTAKEAAEKAGNKEDKVLGAVLGVVVNAAGVASEAADTRSWETLPDKIYVADFELPEGEHDIRAVFKDPMGGVVLRHDFPPVTVKAGEVIFLRARCTH